MELGFREGKMVLIPAIVQDDATGGVLMLGFMNPRSAGQDPGDWVRHVLQPLAQEVVDQGRKQRTKAGTARPARRLRPGCPVGTRED